MISVPLLISAFVAGVVTFLAPCTLPLVPVYLGFLSGTTAGERTPNRRRILWIALLFILGFSIVFVTLGSLAGLFGTSAGPARGFIQRVGGAVIILLGLSMLGVVRIPLLQRTMQARIPSVRRLPSGLRAFLFGVILGSGWTPCIGPILGTILFFAASTATVGTGALLLAVYSVGLSLPFLAVALFYSQAARVIARIASLTRGIEILAGVLLMFIGFLFVTDRMTVFIGASYRALDFLDYDALYRFF
ncbi:MAG: cytochrome c-type bioproteinis protein [Parcubacteria group bacterium Gr01-1014_38]|nr:MAG: cytochrome c-type bioproteinis protein [Parcubacteria group bacterium Gr01-1014_38]